MSVARDFEPAKRSTQHDRQEGYPRRSAVPRAERADCVDSRGLTVRHSFALFLNQKKQTGCTAAHCLAEVYSVLTGMPGKDRASPDEALLFLANVRERLKLVSLTEEEYFRVLGEAAAAGVSGGGVYDAIIGRCAIKAEAIYTWNVKHFNRLGTEVASRARTPDV